MSALITVNLFEDNFNSSRLGTPEKARGAICEMLLLFRMSIIFKTGKPVKRSKAKMPLVQFYTENGARSDI